MDELAARFEERRPQLRAVAYRMLGSLAEADEAVQDAWLRASRAGTDGIENVGGWLRTIVARVCLNALQARKVRSEGARMPDPIVTEDGAVDPERELLLANAVGLALQIVVDTLPPAERLAFVLHDLFDVPFDEIGPLVGRTSAATRQLASRARRRVKEAAVPTSDCAEQRRVVDAFFTATRCGDLEALAALLDPEVVLRADGGERSKLTFTQRGADVVARSAIAGVIAGAEIRPALVNGAAGVVILSGGHAFAVMAFTIVDGKIVEIDVVVGRERVVNLC